MDMIRIPAAEMQKGFRALADLARQGPVAITTDDGREELIVLSAEEYTRLKRRDRRVGLAENLPEEWIETLRVARKAPV